ncbi:MAG: hypothetical protein QOE54_1982, partial [Streptosporangiaceae bacterium]|nr:hypothetical protein [Streptosporangiaceae bacterium]
MWATHRISLHPGFIRWTAHGSYQVEAPRSVSGLWSLITPTLL